MPWHLSADSSRITLERFSNCDLSSLDSLAQVLASQLAHELRLFEELPDPPRQQVFGSELQELHLLPATHLLHDVAFKFCDSEIVVFAAIELDSECFSQQLQRFLLDDDLVLAAISRPALDFGLDFFDSATRSTKNLGA